MNSDANNPAVPGDPSRAGASLREIVLDRVARGTVEYWRQAESAGARLAEFVLLTPEDPHEPAAIFPHLRWGGLVAFATQRRREAEAAAGDFARSGFAIEQGPAPLRERSLWGLAIPLLSRKLHYFVARKICQVLPGEVTSRFTYDVRLVGGSDSEGMVVLKEVPDVQSVIKRLRGKFPEAPDAVIERRARKFTDRIFPMFLGREEAILRELEETLPQPYSRRVPRVLHVERDPREGVRRLWMTWLRNGGRPLSHLEFAHQSTDLLRALHDVARVIHLDLRMDNFVVTEEGVGFVDFGSAVRDNEDLARHPMLGSIFEELMQTSQIQRMLSQMTRSGDVTSEIIRQSHHKADKAIDFFYLAVHFNNPHANPDLVDLIRFDPKSRETRALTELTAQILRPADPANAAFRSARDILAGIERIRQELETGAAPSMERPESSTIH